MSPANSTVANLTVVGVPAEGWTGLAEATRAQVLAADVVLGGGRHLGFLPPVEGQVRRPWPSPLRDGLPALLGEYADARVVVLGSGDPFVSGIGSTLASLGLSFESVPAISSVALALARMGWPAETVEVVSVVGRPLERVLAALAPARRLVVLSADETTPAALAELLRDAGHGAARMSVLGDLGAAEESRTDVVAADWAAGVEMPRLNLVAVELPAPAADTAASLGSWTGGLPDDAFEHDGQLTKRDLRASALARLAPMPGQLLWDVGAGAGSIGIEWMRAHPTCRTIAIEGDPERAARIGRNATRLGVPDVEVVTGRAPDALAGLPRPDAIFVGGGATAPTLLETCLAAVAEGGRVVIHGVTVETEALLAAAHRDHGGELTRIHVETAAPIGTFTGWTPARTVTQWAWTKET